MKDFFFSLGGGGGEQAGREDLGSTTKNPKACVYQMIKINELVKDTRSKSKTFYCALLKSPEHHLVMVVLVDVSQVSVDLIIKWSCS